MSEIKDIILNTRQHYVDAMNELLEVIDELEENEGIMKMLRRHRDEAETRMDQVAEFLWKCLPESRDVTETETKDLESVALKIHVYIKKLERDNEL